MRVLTPSVIIDLLSDKLNLYGFRARIASAVLNKKASKYTKPIDHINLCFDIFHSIPLKYIGWSIAPIQIKQEIQELLSILSEQNICTMLEIGTANGGTLYLFSRILDANARIISLDLPKGKLGGGYESYKIPFFTNFAKENQQIFLVRTDSHSPEALTAVKSILKERKIDFLFIDGDHTYEGVKIDFQMYSPLVRKCGLIAFHDIWEGPPELSGKVNDFWNEIKHTYKHQEIIGGNNQKGFGIGVLYT